MNAADLAWMFFATAMVLMMTPALAFFYGGLARSKNMLNTMMMSFISLGVSGLAWAFFGYSLAFGSGAPIIGDLSRAFLKDTGFAMNGTVPEILFMAYQGTFAIVTAALISGSIVERMRFGAYMLFIALWTIVVYSPVAHWVWGNGWLAKLGALDFAGGTVVHINAATAALVAAMVIGPRQDFGRRAFVPHNVPFTLLGAGFLWFGWFGFNAGSALGANQTALLAFATTFLAPMATIVVWAFLDLKIFGKVTAVGVATAIVVGLVAVTPAAGFVSPVSAIVVGAVAAVPSFFALLYRARIQLDDSLDVVAAHGIGGVVGAVLTGVLAEKKWNGNIDGAVFGNPGILITQVSAILAVVVYSAAGTFLLLKFVAVICPLRAETQDERMGLDVSQHGELAYSEGEGAILIREGSQT